MPPAEQERFRRMEAIFHAALEKSVGADRDTLIRESCPGDEGMQAQIAQLLANDEMVRSALPPAPERLPRFGVWQTIKLLGRGGMGTVYLAERADGAFRMQTAVKVVPLALASPAIEERFRRERQFLAGLDHPRIARLIDGGVSDTGLPYLVMEYVDGQTIDRFCEDRQLDPRARIALVRQVLEALAYVHGQHVIHRDLKASNILVDANGQVKLLDFGTARLIDVTAETALTKTGVFAFTPEYASPEQVRGDSLTFASDLYSVGVLLYRLLSGRLPYRIADASPAAVVQVITRVQPEPSGLDAPLDAIVSKALAKSPASRYASAGEMDADLVRYVEGQRVRARKSRPKLWAALAALVICAAGLIGYRILRPTYELIPFDAGVPNARQPALSRDGKWLAIASSGNDGSHPDIWLKAMPNGVPQRVTGGDAVNDEPSLSPDGRWLAFHSKRSPAGIYVQPAAGGEARLLVASGHAPRFSPDGRSIAYLNTSESGGDLLATNTRMLYCIPAQGGSPVRLAPNGSAVQGFAWSADSRGVYYLSVDVYQDVGLWIAPSDGCAAIEASDFEYLQSHNVRACASTSERFIYEMSSNSAATLKAFLARPRFGIPRSLTAAAEKHLEIVGCTASAGGQIVADQADHLSSAWTLPVDPENARVRGPLTSLQIERRGLVRLQAAADGSTFLIVQNEIQAYLQDALSGKQTMAPGAYLLASGGPFALQIAVQGNRLPAQVRNLKTGETWGLLDTGSVAWDLSPEGAWLLTTTLATHRAITAWNTRTSEHQIIYAHPDANLYLANFSRDGHWVLFTSEQRGQPSHMWAAPFRQLANVPPAEWVDLGEGDYPRWSPSAARIYFVEPHGDFECIFSRAVDPVTKRPTGPIAEVQHLHGPWAIAGLTPGSFRLSVTPDKLVFALGRQVHQLLQWR